MKAVRNSRVGLVAIAMAIGLGITSGAEPVTLAYSFSGDAQGGAALLRVDDASGKILEQRALVQSDDARKAKKVRFSADGNRLAVTVARDKAPNLYVVALPDGKPVGMGMPGEPDEVRAAGEDFLVSCASGAIVLIDGHGASIKGELNARTLTPPAGTAEDVFVTPDASLALVSLQNDHRLLLLGLPTMDLKADLALPRSREGVPLSEAIMRKGPQPEVVLMSTASDTLLVTLDEYGAVGLLSITAALRGETAGMVYLSTALDGSWGETFPDRASLVSVGGKPHALVTNSGQSGGAVLIDLAGQRVVRTYAVPHGLEKPVVLPTLNLAVAAPAGKLKARGAGRRFLPGDALYLFDLRPNAASPGMKALPMGRKTCHVAVLSPTGCPFVAVAAGASVPDQILIVNLKTGKVVDEQPALGVIERIESATP